MSDKGWVGGPDPGGTQKKTHFTPMSLEGPGSSESAWQAAGLGGEMADSLVIGKLPSLA